MMSALKGVESWPNGRYSKGGSCIEYCRLVPRAEEKGWGAPKKIVFGIGTSFMDTPFEFARDSAVRCATVTPGLILQPIDTQDSC